MNSKKRKSPREWHALITEQEASGLSVTAFCQKQGLVDKTFYNQRRKLGFARVTAASPERGFVKVQPSAPSVTASTGCLVLHHRQSRLSLDASVNPRWLAELMGALP